MHVDALSDMKRPAPPVVPPPPEFGLAGAGDLATAAGAPPFLPPPPPEFCDGNAAAAAVNSTRSMTKSPSAGQLRSQFPFLLLKEKGPIKEKD